ncbi:hypothetical protein BOTBODRAFT_172699 [Botryobasidium botryosum FD-172 SS1]|uniref:Uncharacterized protein n=1 Tax=Botryobasidium botryosum (strain FD-172 SS1) TaxID=930990 RepID=A0A067MNI0_BOTB1|nr:hypothetical protein BOTBODRAFT_172699 [Botryobasidium botryosum FD-172 SS1]
MAPINTRTFTGTLPNKKKADLQDISKALSIPSDGLTREEMIKNIKTHLDDNPALQDSTQFSGLYARKSSRKPSAPPESKDVDSSGEEIMLPSSRLPLPRKQSLRKKPLSSRGTDAVPSVPAPYSNLARDDVFASVEKIPRTPAPAHSKSYIAPPASAGPATADEAEEDDEEAEEEMQEGEFDFVPAVAETIAAAVEPVIAAAEMQRSELVTDGERTLAKTRQFLSNSFNIATLTVLVELFYLIYSVVPWEHYTLQTPVRSAPFLIPYHPLVALNNTLITLFWWAIPTLIVPHLVGTLVVFSPAQGRDIDPLSVGIARIACACAGRWGVQDIYLEQKWRILGAAVSVAFALAEAVSKGKIGRTPYQAYGAGQEKAMYGSETPY